MQGVDFDTDSNFDSDIDRAYLFLSMKAKADSISPLRYICLVFDFDGDFDFDSTYLASDFDRACLATGEKAVPWGSRRVLIFACIASGVIVTRILSNSALQEI